MNRYILVILFSLSSVSHGWEPHLHELQEMTIKAPVGKPFGLVTASIALSKPNGKILKAHISSDVGEYYLDASHFPDIDIVRLNSLGIVSFDFGIDGGPATFSLCVRYGIGERLTFAGEQNLYMPVMGIRVKQSEFEVFTLPLPKNNTQIVDRDGCYYLSEW